MSHVISGFATAAGTSRFVERQIGKKKDLYRLFDGVLVSAVGIGTYLGNHDDADDLAYADALSATLLNGCNLIDTAINYRCMRSERTIGAVLRKLIDEKKISRDEVVVCTKGGFLPFDGSPPPDPLRYFEETFISKGVFRQDDIAAGCHCMEPAYLMNQIDRSRSNLALETIDLFYLHNPETQLEEISSDDFYKKLGAAFETLEGAVATDKIRRYGLATWTAFRETGQLSLEKCLEVASRVAGPSHHFRAIQLPYNLAMPEAFTNMSQTLKGESVCTFEAAAELGLSVFCSASIMQGRLIGRLPDRLRSQIPATSDAQRALVYVLSTPGVCTALVGMKQKNHVEENLKVLETAPLDLDQFQALFQKA